MPLLQVQPLQKAHADEADKDQVDRDDVIEKPRHDQDEDARDQGHDGRDVRGGDDHCSVSGMLGNRIESMELNCIANFQVKWVPVRGKKRLRQISRVPDEGDALTARRVPQASRKLLQNAAYAATTFRNNAGRDALARRMTS